MKNPPPATRRSTVQETKSNNTTRKEKHAKNLCGLPLNNREQKEPRHVVRSDRREQQPLRILRHVLQQPRPRAAEHKDRSQKARGREAARSKRPGEQAKRRRRQERGKRVTVNAQGLLYRQAGRSASQIETRVRGSGGGNRRRGGGRKEGRKERPGVRARVRLHMLSHYPSTACKLREGGWCCFLRDSMKRKLRRRDGSSLQRSASRTPAAAVEAYLCTPIYT